MVKGLPEDGVKIALDKCLVNFYTSVEGKEIRRLEGMKFSYCGNTIHTRTLDIMKEPKRKCSALALSFFAFSQTLILSRT